MVDKAARTVSVGGFVSFGYHSACSWTFRDEPLDGWAHPLSLVLYTVLWFMVCRMRRWAAWGYLGLTSVNLMLHFAIPTGGVLHFFSGSMFPIDILFCFFILVYYKKLYDVPVYRYDGEVGRNAFSAKAHRIRSAFAN